MIEVTATPDENQAFGHQIAWKVLGEKEETSVPLEVFTVQEKEELYHITVEHSLKRKFSYKLLSPTLIYHALQN